MESHAHCLFLLGFTLSILQGVNYSQIAPYFPSMAENDKFISTTKIGLITGSFDFSDFLTAFILASFMSDQNQKNFFCVGGLIAACSSVLFGVMDWSIGGTPYVLVCFFVRFVMGIGASMVWSTASLLMVTLLPNSSDRVTSLTESSIGLGIAFGPPIGSSLFAIGGFAAPSFILGALQFFIAVLCKIYLRSPTRSSNKLNIRYQRKRIADSDPGLTYFKYITRPSVLCVSVPLAIQSMSFGFFDVAIGPYLEDTFEVGGEHSGFYFLPFALVYAFFLFTLAPLVEHGYAGVIYLTSISVSAFGFFMLWIPLYYPQLETKAWMLMWLAVQGMTIAASFVPASLIFETLAFDMGFKNTQNVKLVSASWLNGCFALGRKFGPLFTGGFFLDRYGFYKSCFLQAILVCFSLNFAVIAVQMKNLLSLRRYSVQRHNAYELESQLPESGSGTLQTTVSFTNFS